MALYADPARLKEFLKAMTGLSHPANLAIAERFPWQNHRSFVDVWNGARRLGRPGSSRAPTSHGHRIRSAGDWADLRGVCGATPVGHSGKVCPGGFLRTFNPER